MKNSTSIIFLMSIFCSPFLQAQTICDTLYSAKDYSIFMENKNHISYQKTVWRRTSLLEKQNQSFFVKGNEITKVIIDAVLLGKLQPYRNDSLKTEMHEDEFLENLTIPQVHITHEGESEEFFTTENWQEQDENAWSEEKTESNTEESPKFQPNQIYILRTRLDLFFNTRRDTVINKIKSVSFIIPAKSSPATGLDKTLASFSYQEITNYLFDKRNDFVWNNQANLKDKEFFDLMLLNGTSITYLFYDFDSKEDLQKAHSYHNKLIEYESSFWEN